MPRRFTHDTTLYALLGGDAEGVFPARIAFDYSPGDPGRRYGPPELCRPAEAASVEIAGIMLLAGGSWVAADWLIPAATACTALTDELLTIAATRGTDHLPTAAE